jgi:hypothetical protein
MLRKTSAARIPTSVSCTCSFVPLCQPWPSPDFWPLVFPAARAIGPETTCGLAAEEIGCAKPLGGTSRPIVEGELRHRGRLTIARVQGSRTLDLCIANGLRLTRKARYTRDSRGKQHSSCCLLCLQMSGLTLCCVDTVQKVGRIASRSYGSPLKLSKLSIFLVIWRDSFRLIS